MLLRSAIIAWSSLLFVACGQDGSGDSAPDAADLSFAGTLQFTNVASLGSLPNTMQELTVVYRPLFDANIAGVEVDFALTGSAPGASLTPARSVTDATGSATTTLRVGSTTGDIQVRARTATGITAYTTVSVGQSVGTTLAVTLDYQGARPLATYTVTSLPAMSCDAALESDAAGDVSYTFGVDEKKPVTFNVGAGVAVTIVGFGRDATGAPLALGCKQFQADILSDAATAKSALTLTLENQKLAFDDALPVEVQVALEGAATRLGDTAQASLGTLLPGTDSLTAANYYLDAVANALTPVLGTGSSALAERRADGTLAASLASNFDKQKVGPSALVSKAASLLRDRAAQLSVSSTYQRGSLGPVDQALAISSDGTQALTLAVKPTQSITASFSSDTAALRISSLRIDQPLGSFGASVLGALRGEKASGGNAGAQLDAAAGCSDAFSSWWTHQGLDAVCATSFAAQACLLAQGAVLDHVGKALAGLDASASNVVLSGSVNAEDRSEDGQIDDLGPASINGEWGQDAVSANVMRPVKTAFAN